MVRRSDGPLYAAFADGLPWSRATGHAGGSSCHAAQGCESRALGAGVGPVVPWDRVEVEVAAVTAERQGSGHDEALGEGVAAVAEQVAGLAEDEVEFACVVIFDLQADHASQAARGTGRCVDWPAGDEPVRTQFPAVGGQQAIEAGNELRCLLGVRLNQRVCHPGEEVKQHLVGSVGELKARVVEDPSIVPVEVGDPVPDDVLSGGGMAGIG